MATTRVHLLSSERDTKGRQWLTVLIRVEILFGWVSRAEEEDSSIDGDEGRDEREDFQFIETAGDVGSAVEGIMEVDQQKNQNSEGLDDSTERREESVDADHGYFPEHYDWLPIVGSGLVAIVEEA